ncbi:MAG: ATP-binding protein [Paracoccaceae bacterium]
MSDELSRIADALERLAPAPAALPDLSKANVFIWNIRPDRIEEVSGFNNVNLNILRGIDNAKEILLRNTKQFANGFPANNALLWGARGMGKSSLVKAVFKKISESTNLLKLIEIQREDLSSINRLLDSLKGQNYRFLLFCDDLSFDGQDSSYKALKAILDGGVDEKLNNVIFYASSNRRHLMPRDMIENETGSSINPSEAVEEKVSLSDRFGLWLGFHGCDQPTYLKIIEGYCNEYGLHCDPDELYADAIEWQATRGSRSGRVAWQYFIDLAGRKKLRL